jgi:hypothetical protein
LGPVEQHETVDVNINGKGIDILGGDGDNPRTTISDFLTENTDNSIVINVIDERNDGSKFSTIYLYNKDIFIDQLNNSKVFPCREANNLLNSVIRDEPLYSFARLINRRINVHKEELDDFLNNPENQSIVLNSEYNKIGIKILYFLLPYNKNMQRNMWTRMRFILLSIIH